MATVVIVHGGWGGGWEWTPVARKLRERGHEVFTPTLTGLGEREHLGADVGLSDHIEDVVAVIKFEALREVVLCGQSYGGMVITGVADQLADSIRSLVYLDAFVPEHGQALNDLVPAEVSQALLAAAEERADGKMPYPPDLHPPEGSLPEDQRASYIARMRPHPVGTFTEAIRLSGAASALPRAFVRCIGTDQLEAEDSIAPFAARAQAEGWPYREIATPHDLQLFDPEGAAAILHELASRA